MLSASLFESAFDNEPKEATLDLADFLNSFADEPVLVDGCIGLDDAALKKVKYAGKSWGGSFSGTRSKKNFVSIPAVVFDLDGTDGGKDGVDLHAVLDLLEDMNVSYAVHSTFSSGFVAPLHKLRVILPTSRPVNAEEYVRLWDTYAEAFQADTACRAPDRIHFAPRIPLEHKDHYFCRVVTDRPLLRVSSSNGQRDLNGIDLGRPAERDWLQELRTCQNKNETLVRCAFRLGKLAALAGKVQGPAEVEIWAQCEAALNANTVSSPVADWAAARSTVTRGVANGYRVAAEEMEENTDPLEDLETSDSAPDKKRADKADRDLNKYEKELKKSPTKKMLERCAFFMGQYLAEGAHDEETVRARLTKAAAHTGTLPVADIATALETGLAGGRARAKRTGADWTVGLKKDQDGQVISCDENVLHILRNHPDTKGLLYTDTRADAHMLRREPPWDCDTVTFPAPFNVDTATPAVLVWLNRELECMGSIGIHRAKECLVHVAAEIEVDPFREYLEGLTWDGTPRLERWLVDYVGAEDGLYSRAVGKRWLIGAVARTFVPGCKMDNVLVLTGAQGIGKSTTFAKLVPESSLFTDSLPSMDDKDSAIALHKAVIVEMAELSHMRKHDMLKVKQFITSTGAAVRPAYARVAREFKRRGVLAGTTNESSDFLEDSTGGRRFWIVAAKTCNPAGIAKVRDQLWAEAVHMYHADEQWNLTSEENELASEMQDAATRQDVREDDLRALVIGPFDSRYEGHNPQDPGAYIELLPGQKDEQRRLKFVTLKQVCTLMQLDLDRGQTVAARLVRQLGWGKKQIRIGTERYRAYFRPE